MKTPYWLAENGYIPDSENPLHFTNPNGHPFHPVTFTRDRQHNQGECLEAMLEAAHVAGFTKGVEQSQATRQLDAPPAVLAGDPQCDGCRWSWNNWSLLGKPDEPWWHCYQHLARVENCPEQEIEHPRWRRPGDASGNLPVSNSVKNVRINID